MVPPGAWATFTLAAVAAAGFLAVAAALFRRRAGGSLKSPSAPLLFLLMGLALAAGAPRNVLPAGSDALPHLTHLGALFAALATLPLVHLAILIQTGARTWARAAAIAYAFVALSIVATTYAAGWVTDVDDAWGRGTSLAGPLSHPLLLLAVSLPVFAAIGTLLHAGGVAASGRRLRLVGAACLAFYGSLVATGIGLLGTGALAPHLGLTGASALGVLAYVPLTTRHHDAPAPAPEPFNRGT